MAYMSQDQKKEIHANLKNIMPKDWKWSLKVRNHSTIVLTIRKAPINLLPKDCDDGYRDLNEYYIKDAYKDNDKLSSIFSKIIDCLNLNNHDNSDVMTDYFDVGHYIDLRIGEWNKPFVIS